MRNNGMLQFLGKVRYVLQERRFQLIKIVSLFAFTSMLDVLGIGLIGPFIGAIVDPTLLDRLSGLRWFFSIVGVADTQNQIVFLAFCLFIVFSMKGIAGYSATCQIYAFGVRFRTYLVNRLMLSYMRMPYRFYLERNSSAIVQSVLSNTKALSDELLTPSLRLCSDLLLLSVLGAFLFWVSPLAVILLAILLGSVTFTYLKIVRPKVKKSGETVTLANERVIRGVNQAIAGIKEIRTLRAEDYFLGDIASSTKECSSAQAFFLSQLVLPRFLMEGALVLFIILFSLFVLFMKDGEVNLVPVLAAFGAAGIRILPSLTQLSSSIASMTYSAHALDEVYKDLRYAEANVEVSNPQDANASQVAGSGFQSATLREVTYQYDNALSPAIDGITLNISRGQSIGLIGESGAGKSTLVDILLGLHTFSDGTFTVDGEDISAYGWDRWRDRIAYIPQNVFLIDDSLARNIALGQQDSSIDHHKLGEAIKAAQLSRLVDRLPEGMGTKLGERGIRLSGGERQRIALARAYYSGRDFLIMDEATSALDNETERQVIEVIDALHGKITLLVIAHRLSTVAGCDVIYRLKNGKIVATGNFLDVVPAENPIQGRSESTE
jgi:ABC-type multidrug transport system fused ATPase/permease subunit